MSDNSLVKPGPSKLLLVGDVHLRATRPIARVDDFSAAQKKKLTKIVARSCELGAPIVCTGDLFDKPDPPYSLLTEYIALMRTARYGFYVTPGNHDVYGDSLTTLKRTAIGVCESAGVLTILSSTPIQIASAKGKPVFLHGCSYIDDRKPTPVEGAVNVLVAHEMILVKKLFDGQTNYTYAADYLKNNPGWDLILSGHYHYRFLVTDGGRKIVNPGAMVRIRASREDMSLEPGYYVYDLESGELKLEYLDFEPSEFVFASRSKLDRANDQLTDKSIDEFVASLVTLKSTNSESTDNLDSLGSLGEVVRRLFDETKPPPEVRQEVLSWIAEAEEACKHNDL